MQEFHHDPSKTKGIILAPTAIASLRSKALVAMKGIRCGESPK